MENKELGGKGIGYTRKWYLLGTARRASVFAAVKNSKEKRQYVCNQRTLRSVLRLHHERMRRDVFASIFGR
ncbi:hypothetical protein EVAR_61266_1 [Eumeta japonica]|uniref:Uncharacterized protein n=1 Tax=Eumeta variegata TaxID=151549 RepID=A0A4C1Z3C9_EUMVA|nr:hypothetical protein EVAR_61266_1 [Eumeta japonica]